MVRSRSVCLLCRMHRLFVVQQSSIYEHEKEYCDSYIEDDNKNIHSWTHRLWAVETFNLWEGEMEYTDSIRYGLAVKAHS